MEKSMKRYMKVGTILHVSYKEVGSVRDRSWNV